MRYCEAVIFLAPVLCIAVHIACLSCLFLFGVPPHARGHWMLLSIGFSTLNMPGQSSSRAPRGDRLSSRLLEQCSRTPWATLRWQPGGAGGSPLDWCIASFPLGLAAGLHRRHLGKHLFPVFCSLSPGPSFFVHSPVSRLWHVRLALLFFNSNTTHFGLPTASSCAFLPLF
jgi:hypothetical protein